MRIVQTQILPQPPLARPATSRDPVLVNVLRPSGYGIFTEQSGSQRKPTFPTVCVCARSDALFFRVNRFPTISMQNAELTSGNPDEGRPVKRKRIALACEPCRDRKVKCDGTKPTCKVCEKRADPKIQCLYTLVPQTAKQISEQEYVLPILCMSHASTSHVRGRGRLKGRSCVIT